MFGIDAGLGGLSFNSLKLFNPFDIIVLVLASLSFVGFWPGPGKAHRVWMGIAVTLPLAGTVVLLVTGVSGRSALMGAGLVISLMMLGSDRFRLLAYLGIAANGLLLAGDFATSGARAPLVAVGIAVGYVLLIAWFLWIAARMFDRKHSSRPVRR
jgi:hypothetical protein